jgi:hypothetical protein
VGVEKGELSQTALRISVKPTRRTRDATRSKQSTNTGTCYVKRLERIVKTICERRAYDDVSAVEFFKVLTRFKRNERI